MRANRVGIEITRQVAMEFMKLLHELIYQAL